MEALSVQNYLQNEIDSMEILLTSLNHKCASLQNADIQNAFAQIDTNIQILKGANLNQNEYDKLNLILQSLDEIKEMTNKNKELQAVIKNITEGLKKIRKELYFAVHLSATLNKVNETDRENEKRALKNQVDAYGKTYQHDYKKCIEKQIDAVLTTYEKLSQSSSKRQITMFDPIKLSDILETFMKAENIEYKKTKAAPVQYKSSIENNFKK